ncbi:MAG: hypothetical protein LQ342_007434 [Letrouitia transgressa]|nr:MAG: hypothetical protein LQ342_007434 [Letrouitia transgressa]
MERMKLDQETLARLKAANIGDHEITSLLEAHGIQATHILPLLQCKYGYPCGGDQPKPVLIIDVDATSIPDKQEWSAARRDLWDLLASKNLGDFDVEIYDPHRRYNPSLFPVKSDAPNALLYQKIRQEILQIVQQELGSSWTSMSMYGVGRTSDKATDSAVVMVEPTTVHDWLSLTAKIGRVIEEQRASGQIVPIEIFPGAWSNRKSGKEGKVFWTSLSDSQRVSCSIGLKGEAESGSLGGFFFLKFNNIRYKGFLTCAHVVRPTPRPGLENDLKELDLYGLRIYSKNAERARTDIVYFSEADAEATKKVLDIEIKIEAKKVARFEEEVSERGYIEKDMSSEKWQLVNLQAYLKARQALQKRMEKLPYLFGQTLVLSGREMSQQRKILDYAFVRCKDPQKTKPPFFNPQYGHNQPTVDRVKTPRFYSDSTEAYVPHMKNFKLRGMSTIAKDCWYFKKGRTTGLTTGICNGVETYLRSFKPRCLLEYSEEFVILNSPRDRPDAKQANFAQEGDSGSLVIDDEGCAAGLLIAKIINWCGPTNCERYVGAGIVTPIDTIQQAISDRISQGSVHGSLELAT